MNIALTKQNLRKFSTVGLVFLVLSIFCAPARADAYSAGSENNYAEPVNWNGFYLGVMAGYDWSGYKSSATNFNFDGFADGLFLGLNVEERGLLYGLEVRLSWTTLSETSGMVTATLPWDSDVRMRFGTVYEDTLLFGALGVAFTNMTYQDKAASSQNTHLGWNAGLGGEYNLGNGLFARTEYSYTGYFTARYNSANGIIDARPGDHQQARLGIGIRF